MSEHQPPFGYVFQPIIVNPAAGANFSYTLAAGKIYKLLSCHFRFVTDATVINRNVALHVSTPGGVAIEILPVGTHGASATYDYTFAPGLTPLSDITGNRRCAPVPLDYWIESAGAISSQVANIQAADQISSVHLILMAYQRT